MKSSIASKEHRKLKDLLNGSENKTELYKSLKTHHKSHSLNPSIKISSDFLTPDSFNTDTRAPISLIKDSSPKFLNVTHEQSGSLSSLPKLPSITSNKSLSTKPSSQLFHPLTQLETNNSASKQSFEQPSSNNNLDPTLNVYFTPKIQNKHIRSSFHFESRTPVEDAENLFPPPYDKSHAPTPTEIYLSNRKKFLPQLFSQGFTNSPKPDKNKDAVFNLRKIKEALQIHRRNRGISRDEIALQKLRMVQEINRDRQKLILTKEDELKISILKRKIAINSLFGMELKNINSTVEERKQMFKNLLLEFHPDKKKHDKEIAEEMCNYLLINKQLFIEG